MQEGSSTLGELTGGLGAGKAETPRKAALCVLGGGGILQECSRHAPLNFAASSAVGLTLLSGKTVSPPAEHCSGCTSYGVLLTGGLPTQTAIFTGFSPNETDVMPDAAPAPVRICTAPVELYISKPSKQTHVARPLLVAPAGFCLDPLEGSSVCCCLPSSTSDRYISTVATRCPPLTWFAASPNIAHDRSVAQHV